MVRAAPAVSVRQRAVSARCQERASSALLACIARVVQRRPAAALIHSGGGLAHSQKQLERVHVTSRGSARECLTRQQAAERGKGHAGAADGTDTALCASAQEQRKTEEEEERLPHRLDSQGDAQRPLRRVRTRGGPARRSGRAPTCWMRRSSVAEAASSQKQ